VSRLATVALHKDTLHFSAGHFTIFSATEREDLHGHNYYVEALFDVLINDNGLAFDYRFYRNKIQVLCTQLDRHFLLPAKSKFLRLEEKEEIWYAHFHNEKIPFLKRDVIILPICNITIEELSNWFLQHLIHDANELALNNIQGLTIRVYNGPGQSGGAEWKKDETTI